MMSKEDFREFLLNRSKYFIPSWLILIKDLLIVVFSFSFAYTLRFNFQIPDQILDRMYDQFILVVLISLIVFLALGINRSVIRHTGIRDAIHVVKAQFITTAWMLLVYMFHDYDTYIDIFNFPRAVIVIFFVLSTTLIIFIRSAIRLLYYWLKSGNKVTKVLIYGAGTAGIITKSVLVADQSRPVKVVGFVDNNSGKIGKTIEGIYVYSMAVLNPNFISKYGIDEIIFSIQNIEKERKRAIIEELLLKTQIQVKEVPPVESWINGELSSRQIGPVKITDLLQRSEIKLDNKHVRNEIQGKRILVTGAAGSIGSELVRQLCKFNPSLLVMVDQGETPMFHLENELTCFNDVRLEFIIANVEDPFLMKRVFEEFKPQIVYHAAAYKHVPLMERNPIEAVRVNIFGTKNIADMSVKFGVEKFVMISTDKAVNPTNVMGATKRAAEIYIQSLSTHIRSLPHVEGKITEFITTRFGNVLGSNGSVIPVFEKQIAAGGPVTVTDPEITRYFMTIPEACQLVLEAGSLGCGGEILMFDMGKPVKIKDLAYNMIRLKGLEPNKDIRILFTGLRPGEKLYEELLYDKEKGHPTHNPKIFIGMQKPYPINYVLKNICAIQEVMGLSIKNNNGMPNDLANQNMMLVAQLKQFIPEYKSNNSIYQELDASA